MECAPGDHRIAPIEILNFSDYEKEESLMMDRLLRDGDTFFDVGANIGWYSINMAVSRRNSKVFSFEPIPKTYNQLQRKHRNLWQHQCPDSKRELHQLH